MNTKLIVIAVVLCVCIAFGTITTNAEDQNQIESQWYWSWRQPPYEIILSSGYSYILPEVRAIACSGPNPDDIYISSIHYFFDPPEMYPPGGIYHSANRGRTWEHIFDSNNDIEVLVVHPVTSTIILAGDTNTNPPGGIYRSQDGGKNWTSVLPDKIIYDIEIDDMSPQRIYASTCCLPTGTGGVYRSEDTGQTWQKISDEWLRDIEVQPIISGTIFGARSFTTNSTEGIYRSDDGGETWSQIASNSTLSHLLIDERYPDRMFAFGDGPIFKTEDGGKSWTDISAGLPNPLGYTIVASAALTPLSESTLLEDTLWIGMRYAGMFISYDAGGTWHEVNSGIYLAPIWGTDCTAVSMCGDGIPVVNCRGRFYARTRLDQNVFLPIIIK